MRIEPAAEWTDADRKVAAWVVDDLRSGRGTIDPDGGFTAEQRQHRDHLRTCPTLRVVSFDAFDSTYGCDTGCEFLRIEGWVACNHDTGDTAFETGEFGVLENFLEDLDKR